MLNAFSIDLIERFPLGFVATVSAEGEPSVSPKGTFFVLDDRTIAFADIRSPNTLANLMNQPKVEVNFIDIWLRKGIRISGVAETHEKGAEAFNKLFPKWETAFPTLAPRINAIVCIEVERARLLTTPPYDDGATEEEMVALYKQKFAEIYP